MVRRRWQFAHLTSHSAISRSSDKIEFSRSASRIRFPAINAWRCRQVGVEEEVVATAQRPRAPFGSPRWIDAPGTGAMCRSAAVAVGADELTLSDLVDDELEAIPLADELAYLGPLIAHVVELEDSRITEPAVRAAT
jgi:hypothetical protein